jgi:hypothetical protein
MTETEWVACTDPMPMLEFVRGKASDRKLRLIAVACCRGALRLLQSQNYRNAVEVSERFADGLASDDKLRKARSQARESAGRTIMVRVYPSYPWSRHTQSNIARGVVGSVCSRDIYEVIQAINNICVTANNAESYEAKREDERRQRAQLLRDVVRYPLTPLTLNPSWLTSTVLALANGIYEERAFDRMPILADALQDAGCDNEGILNHCQQSGEHVRGCWVIDSILGFS